MRPRRPRCPVSARRPIVTPAELEPIAGHLARALRASSRRRSAPASVQGAELDAFLVGNGHNPADWQAAYDGWNARMKANMGVSTQYGTLYQQAAAL